MGNHQSRPNTASPTTPTSSQENSRSTLTRREPRRRDSLQALPSTKATAAPPSESLESATAHSATSTTRPSQHLPSRPPPRPRDAASQLPSGAAAAATAAVMGNELSRDRSNDEESEIKPFNPTQPVNVPAPSGDAAVRRDPELDATRDVVLPSAPPHDIYHHVSVAPSQVSRPPRLPLPIEEELHTPGSPILSPEDLSTALDHQSVEGVLPRRASVLSSNVDEDDVGDELHAYTLDGENRRTVPTVLEWNQGGEKVYVTGTFASWNRKFRLHKDPDKGRLSAIVQLPPGTHHLKFIVDGEMRTSDNMPTAVDYTNILVNYIEVSATDLPSTASSQPADAQREPFRVPVGVFPPQVLPPTPELRATTLPAEGSMTQSGDPAGPARPRQWTSKIPQYLIDLDQPEESPAYQRAAGAISTLPQPPTLPLFLSKSILNGSTPMKDDSSVLNLPNHTVLNHLATSSIKSGVLATSVTTRFKKKHVTTILYKPTSEVEESG